MDIIFIGLYFTFPILIYYLLKAAKYPINEVSIPSVFVGFYIVVAYIGIFALYFQWDEYRSGYNGINDKDQVLELFLMSALNLVALVFGFFLIPKRATTFYPIVNKTYSPTFINKIFIIFLVFISVILIIHYLRQVSSVALFIALFGGEETTKVARSSMTGGFSGKLHWYRLFYQDILSYCALLMFSQYLKTKTNLQLFIVIFIIAFFGLLLSGQKGPAANFILAMWFLFVIQKQNKTISMRSLLAIGIAVVILLIWLYTLLMGADDILIAFQSLCSRVFTGQIAPAYHYLAVFPKTEPYLLGGSFPNTGGFLPYTPVQLTRMMAAYVYPITQENVVTTVPTVYWAEMYANFGPYGAFLSSILLGMLLSFSDIRISSWPHKSGVIAFYVWLIFYFKKMTGTGLSMIFSLTPLIPLLMILFVVAKIKGMYKYKANIRDGL